MPNQHDIILYIVFSRNERQTIMKAVGEQDVNAARAEDMISFAREMPPGGFAKTGEHACAWRAAWRWKSGNGVKSVYDRWREEHSAMASYGSKDNKACEGKYISDIAALHDNIIIEAARSIALLCRDNKYLDASKYSKKRAHTAYARIRHDSAARCFVINGTQPLLHNGAHCAGSAWK